MRRLATVLLTLTVFFSFSSPANAEDCAFSLCNPNNTAMCKAPTFWQDWNMMTTRMGALRPRAEVECQGEDLLVAAMRAGAKQETAIYRKRIGWLGCDRCVPDTYVKSVWRLSTIGRYYRVYAYEETTKVTAYARLTNCRYFGGGYNMRIFADAYMDVRTGAGLPRRIHSERRQWSVAKRVPCGVYPKRIYIR